uniref:C-type lectin domain-containing protein n=1 Tax=Stegastes partitus TaxID=144197 RepID=A0A3B5BCS8_9TELE
MDRHIPSSALAAEPQPQSSHLQVPPPQETSPGSLSLTRLPSQASRCPLIPCYSKINPSCLHSQTLFLVQKNVLVLLCVFLEAQHCEWVNFDSSAYCVSSTMKNWQESRDDCIQKGADLVIINSQEEQHFLLQFERFVWIGLTDSTAEGEWKWVDGTPMNERCIHIFKPNGGTNENCGEVKRIFSTNSWNDEECSMKHSWICEKRVSP